MSDTNEHDVKMAEALERTKAEEAKVAEAKVAIARINAPVELFKTLATFGFAVAAMFCIGSPLILCFAPGLKACFGSLIVMAGVAGFSVVSGVLVAYFILSCKK